jgi:uncharacterized protein (TIGR02266 family)
MEPPKNRRLAPRYAVAVEVTLESEHNFFTGLTQDLSAGGVFVATNSRPVIGERVQVRITLPTSPTPLDILTVVRWVRMRDLPGGGGKAGVGLLFVELSPEARRAIEAFLTQRESLFVDVD